MARKPTLDATVFPHKLDELGRVSRVVQPAAAVDNVVLLQDAQPRADGWRVGKYEYLPAVVRRMRLEHLLEPRYLLVIDRHLVRCVLSCTEHRRAHADEERLVSDLPHELRRLFFMDATEGL